MWRIEACGTRRIKYSKCGVSQKIFGGSRRPGLGGPVPRRGRTEPVVNTSSQQTRPVHSTVQYVQNQTV